MVIGVVGTTIAPWMQFYLQASIVEKGVTKRGFQASRLDVITGCVFTDIVAWFIIVACAATLYVHGFRDIKYAADAAQALKPLGGGLRLHSLRRRTVQRIACSRLRSCHFRPPTPYAKGWDSSPAWT